MLENYFVRPELVDRIRASWIGSEIEQYVDWLADQGYGANSVLAPGSVGAAFGEFAGVTSAQPVVDLPAHVDVFVAESVGESWGDRYSIGQYMAKEVRGPVGGGSVSRACRSRLRGLWSSASCHPVYRSRAGVLRVPRGERGLRPDSVRHYAAPPPPFRSLPRTGRRFRVCRSSLQPC